MRNRPECVFLQRRCLSGHKICAKDVQQAMQIKATVIYYLTPIRIAIIKTTKSGTEVGHDVGKLEPFHIVGKSVKWCRCDGKEHGKFSEY